MAANASFLRISLWCALVAVAGCSQRPSGGYTASEATQKLSPELQRRIAAVLVEQCGTPETPKWPGDSSPSVQHLLHGRDVYLKRCWQCHGVDGDGAGPAAKWLTPRPRDYRRGMFKFISTPYGSKPRHEDLKRTIRVGIPGTSMPSFSLLPDHDQDAVIDYILVLTYRGEMEFQMSAEAEASEELPDDVIADLIGDVMDRWKDLDAKTVHPATPQPAFTAENVAAGKQAFLTKGCASCHGKDGRGLTPENLRGDLKDFWGHRTMAADLTSGMLHGGREPLDVYRRIAIGINGTPMPGFRDALAAEPDTIWNLAAYVLYVSNRRRAGEVPEASPLFVVPPVAAATPQGD